MTKRRAHVVRAGDFLAKLAYEHGFKPDDVWNDDANAELRKLRADPDMLVPGDVIYFSPKDLEPHSLSTGTTNVIAGRIPNVPMCLRFVRNGRPAAGVHYAVKGFEVKPGVADAEGCIRLEVPVTLPSFMLYLVDFAEVYEVKVGHLDPPDTPSGAQMRLACLGVYGRPGNGSAMFASEEHLAAGLRAFQATNGLDVSGVLDDATVKKLVEQFGS